MRKSTLTIILVALSVHAAAQPYGEQFYGGDLDFRAFLESGRNTAIEDARIYDNFETAGVVIEWVFANLLLEEDQAATQLFYEFRQNVGPGNGGDLVASGTVAAITFETGNIGFGMNEWQMYGDIPRLSLEHGHYWFSVTPVGNVAGHYYQPTTTGKMASANRSVTATRTTTAHLRRRVRPRVGLAREGHLGLFDGLRKLRDP
ncbi:MAG: hypothetical protein ACR2HJ_03740 [Fimbriimonadales bacterium]